MPVDVPSSVSLFHLLRADIGTSLPLLHCTKATLVHLSHTLEDLVLRQRIPALLFTGFQESSHWREETERYRALAEIAQQVCIFAGGSLPPESSASELHITLAGDDPLRQEWFLALLCPQFAVILCGQDRMLPATDEATRQFDTLWSFNPEVVNRVLDLLEDVIVQYRPERLDGLRAARQQYPPQAPDPDIITMFTSEMIRFEEELHQRLAASTNVLNKLLRWREDLLATLVHDMRTPLSGMITALDMLILVEDADREFKHHALTTAKRSGSNLQNLMQLILDTNQLDEGQLQPQWKPLKPHDLLDQAFETLDGQLAANELNAYRHVDEGINTFWGDESLLCRAIQNLLVNAVKFTAPGGRIDAGITLAPTGELIELRVRDTGRGIVPSAQPYIFDRYYQGQDQDRRGSGLGLYFCKLVAAAHGGSIRLESQVGVGTAITMILPIRPLL